MRSDLEIDRVKEVLIGATMVSVLNRVIKMQGMEDMRVEKVSADFESALVSHWVDGRLACRGWVRSEILLADVS